MPIADYDPIDHLNALFSHPSTLSAVPKTSKALRAYQKDLDHEIASHVEHQSTSDADSVKRIQEAKADLAELFEKVEGVRKRAIETEEAITEMTADIKRLDNTKKNLTLSMTALKRLQMLTTAYEQLRDLSASRQYRECAQLLQAVIQLMAQFKSYRSIDQIATLSRNVSDLQREMLEQVCEDFEVTFAKGEVAQTRGMLAEACLVMDALGDNARSRLITWYCNTQLREYRHLFRGSEEAGSLDNISMRYSWFKRMLKTYDHEHAALFPPAWRVNELLANAFCEGTRDDFRGILQKAMRKTDGQTLDVNLLLNCLQETLDFEHGLERKFTNESRASMDTVSSIEEKAGVFSHAISDAFEPYLSVWVEAQEKHLANMIPKYKQEPPRKSDEEFSPQMVITSSTDLFNFYRLTFSQCAKLSTGARLSELSKVFAKYLDQYAQQILLYYVSEHPSGVTPSRNPSIEDLVLVLNTADYCYNTSTQLEERIKSRIDAELRDQVDLQSQADSFMGIASATVRALVRKVEVAIEPSLREMRNVGWGKMEKTGDESPYVMEMLSRIRSRAAEILGMLHKSQYQRAFCDNVVELTANAYIANIFQCKPISEVGAEQVNTPHSTNSVRTCSDIDFMTSVDAARHVRSEVRVRKPSVHQFIHKTRSHPASQLHKTRRPINVAHQLHPQNAPSPTIPTRGSRAGLPHPHRRQIRHQFPQGARSERIETSRPVSLTGALLRPQSQPPTTAIATELFPHPDTADRRRRRCWCWWRSRRNVRQRRIIIHPSHGHQFPLLGRKPQHISPASPLRPLQSRQRHHDRRQRRRRSLRHPVRSSSTQCNQHPAQRDQQDSRK